MAEYINKADAKETARKVISELCADDGDRVVAEIKAYAELNKVPIIDIVNISGDDLMKAAQEWNHKSSKKIPYEAVIGMAYMLRLE